MSKHSRVTIQSNLLDANIFIQAKNLHYGFDFCPAFWEWLVEQNTSERMFSIDKVADEIAAGDDNLKAWAQKQGADFFLMTDENVVAQFGKVSEWAGSQNYEQGAINTFLQGADYYLVAHALTSKRVVVTHEVPSGSTRSIKLPNVCADLNLRCMNPYEMLRREKARFVLGGSA